MCSIMLASFIILTVLGTTTLAGYAGSGSNSVNGGYGFAGSFSGAGAPPGGIPGPPIPNFDFGALSSYLDSLQKYHQQFVQNGNAYSYALTSSNPSSNAQAQSSITFAGGSNGGIQDQAQYAGGVVGGGGGGGYAGPAGGPGFYGGGYGGSFSGGSGGAVASGSIGPGGGYQSASVYPENPNNPNIETRFGASPGGGGGGDGGPKFVSVFTSSQSGSSDVNGHPHGFHRATTTVNDNGKVTTYTVKNP